MNTQQDSSGNAYPPDAGEATLINICIE